MSEVRRQVREYVHENPGVHFRGVVRNLDVATGQAQYHLRELRRAGDVVSEDVRDRTHYFDPGYDPWERRLLALYRQETVRAILEQLLDGGPVRAPELADRLDLARSTVSWHVSSLVEAGVVEKAYADDGTVEVELARPAETRRLLGSVTPSVSDRLVDRFTRLVDTALADDADD